MPQLFLGGLSYMESPPRFSLFAEWGIFLHKIPLSLHINHIEALEGKFAAMLQTDELKRLAPLAIYFGIYTALFLLWKSTFLYSLPFLLGLLAAAAVQPAIRFAQRRLGMNRGLAAGLATGIALALLLAGLGLLGIYGVKEISAFLARTAQGGFPDFSPPVRAFLSKIIDFCQGLSLQALNLEELDLAGLAGKAAGLVVPILQGVLGLLTSLPAIVTMLLVTGMAAFYFSLNFSALADWAKSLLSSKAMAHVKAAAKSSSGAGGRYVLSYLLIYGITFCEAFVILYLLGLPYPLMTAAITCGADLLPVLGPGIVFTPIAIYQVLIGEYARSGGLLVGWLVITCVRQVIEPRLVASTVRIHPLAMMAGVYFSLVAGSFWVLLYVAGLCMGYGALRETGALPEIKKSSTDSEASE